MKSNKEIIVLERELSRFIPNVIIAVVAVIVWWITRQSEDYDTLHLIAIGAFVAVIQFTSLKTKWNCNACQKLNKTHFSDDTTKCSHCKRKYFVDWI